MRHARIGFTLVRVDFIPPLLINRTGSGIMEEEFILFSFYEAVFMGFDRSP